MTAGLFASGLLSTAAVALLLVIAAPGWGYSLPPIELSRRGLGEVDNALLGGLLLPHYGAATLGPPSLAVCYAVVPFALPFAAWGVATFTRDERPLPTVAAMVVMAVAQLVAWSYVAGLVG